MNLSNIIIKTESILKEDTTEICKHANNYITDRMWEHTPCSIYLNDGTKQLLLICENELEEIKLLLIKKYAEMAADILLSALTAVKVCPITEKLIIVMCFCHTWEKNATQFGNQ